MESYEAGQIKARHDSISLNMENLLKNNGIELSANDNLLLSFNPYNFGVNELELVVVLVSNHNALVLLGAVACL